MILLLLFIMMLLVDIYSYVDEEVVFLGGFVVLKEWIMWNLSKLEKVKLGLVIGKVYVCFVVGEMGEIVSVEVFWGILKCEECNVEVIYLVKFMLKWLLVKI